MSRVIQAAGHSAVQLFGAITVLADAFSSTISAAGNTAEVLNDKSNHWLAASKIKSAALAEDREENLVDEITFSMSHRMVEREKILAANPALKTAYDGMKPRIQAAVDRAKTQVYGKVQALPVAPQIVP